MPDHRVTKPLESLLAKGTGKEFEKLGSKIR